MNDRKQFETESLSQDAVHGYISFSSPRVGEEREGETASERQIIDSPWIQRLRQIHQLQTAWLVYPTAEHSRFQHVLGTMHLASRVWHELSASFYRVFDEHPALGRDSVPSSACVESLLRMAGLLHDVGHGPFGHFFDHHFLSRFRLPQGGPLTHETLGAEIIKRHFSDLIRGIRQNPNGVFAPGESLNPDYVTFLIVRPREGDTLDGGEPPLWLQMLRGLFSGLYTIDNMDFVLRDAYMAGYNVKAFDLDRLLHYSFFTEEGVTIHHKGLASLIQFMNARADLFRSLYFHRKVRAFDIELGELFQKSADLLYPWGNPLDSLDHYLHFTEWSLLAEVDRWPESPDQAKRDRAGAWHEFLQRRIPWRMLAEKNILTGPGDRDAGTIFSDVALFEAAVRAKLPDPIRAIPLRFDIARHFHRPGTHSPSGKQNFIYDPTTQKISNLESEAYYRSIPRCFRLCRVYGTSDRYQREIAVALESLTTSDPGDDLTNM